MKALKSLSEFQKETKCLYKDELKIISAGWVERKWDKTCQNNCEDWIQMEREHNPMTGRVSPWYQLTKVLKDVDC